jgi:hypothetical protein
MDIAATPAFRFFAPEAMSVLRLGDFSHSQQRGIPMQKR